MSSTDIQYAACYTEHGIHAFDVDMHQPGRYSAFCLCGKSYGLGRNIAFGVTTEFNPDSPSACAECVKRVRALLLDVPGWTQDCDVCGKALGASAFLPDGRRKSGRRSTCTACVDQDRAARKRLMEELRQITYREAGRLRYEAETAENVRCLNHALTRFNLTLVCPEDAGELLMTAEGRRSLLCLSCGWSGDVPHEIASALHYLSFAKDEHVAMLRPSGNPKNQGAES